VPIVITVSTKVEIIEVIVMYLLVCMVQM